MLHLNYCEFYITNVCNLACPGCNRFNNYKFTGFQKWNDYAKEYAEWASQLRISNIGILGGEPLLNVDFKLWATGIRALWPRAFIKITTNGFYLDKIDGLYDLVKTNQLELQIGIHNKQHKPKLMEKIQQFLQGPLNYEFNNDNIYQQYMYVTDANRVRIKVEYNWWFHQGALIAQDGTFALHQSDVEIAHNNCHMKTCHHFIRGKLYKCGVVALLPEFSQQHKLDISQDDFDLMMSYKPLSVTDDHQRKQEFVNNIENSIPQCKFCPEVYNGQQIFALEKGTKT